MPSPTDVDSFGFAFQGFGSISAPLSDMGFGFVVVAVCLFFFLVNISYLQLCLAAQVLKQFWLSLSVFLSTLGLYSESKVIRKRMEGG